MRLLFFALLTGFAAYYLSIRFFPPHQPLEVEISVNAPEARYQVTGGLLSGFEKANRVVAPLNSGGSFARLKFDLPPSRVEQIQIEPGFAKADIYITKICVARKDLSSALCWEGDGLLDNFRPRRDISHFRLVNGSLHIQSVGSLPRFETNPEISGALLELSHSSRRYHYAISILLALFAGALLWIFQQNTVSPDLPLSASRLRVLLVVSCFLIGISFLHGTTRVAEIVPSFQGADEPAHLSRLLSHLGVSECGRLPKTFAQLNAKLDYLKRSPERKFSLNALTEAHTERGAEFFDDGSCRYNSLYVALPSLFLGENVARIPSVKAGVLALHEIRRAVALSSLLIFSLSMLLVCFGRPLPWVGIELAGSFRLAGLLAIFHVMFLPQTIWLSSVLSQDYVLIGAGVFLTISLGLRIPVLTEAVFMVCFFAAASKGVYLLPVLGLVLAHFFFLFAKNPRATLFLLFGFLGTFLVGILGKLASSRYCTEDHCYGLEMAGAFKGWTEFSAELSTMFRDFFVMSVPEYFYRDSAFGSFGWLDSPMPSHFASLYAAPLSLAMFLGLGGMAILFFKRDNTQESIAIRRMLSVVVMHWLLSVVTIYCVFLIMQRWCGLGSEFGCGYQRRYELPLYAPLVLAMFWTALLAFREERASVVFYFFIVAQGLVASFSFEGQLDVLSRRYHDDASGVESYRELLQGSESGVDLGKEGRR